MLRAVTKFFSKVGAELNLLVSRSPVLRPRSRVGSPIPAQSQQPMNNQRSEQPRFLPEIFPKKADKDLQKAKERTKSTSSVVPLKWKVPVNFRKSFTGCSGNSQLMSRGRHDNAVPSLLRGLWAAADEFNYTIPLRKRQVSYYYYLHYCYLPLLLLLSLLLC